MKKSKLIAGVAVIAAAVAAGLLWMNGDTSADDVASNNVLTSQPPTAADNDAIERGRYVAIASDCTACHTKPESKLPLAGGYSISTPFGGIYASNITPDSETGIGNWTERDFFRAVRHGKGKEGEHLYPAMPYNAYVKLTDQDMHDLWMYLRSVKPIHYQVPETNLGFPYNIRLAMMGWNLLFFRNEGFQIDNSKSAEWNRGAYLVEGPEHCAACHTAKNLIGGDSSDYLQGGNLGEWHAPDITPNPHVGIGRWSEQQVMDYLKLGSNPVAVASGPMAEAVTNSTQHLTDADLRAIAVYLKQVPASTTTLPQPLSIDNAQMKMGENVYSANCTACHNSDGKGIPNLAASLANNPGLLADDASSIITTVLQGGRGAVTAGNPTSGAMPSFAWKLSDEQVAAVATYLRNSWGNTAKPVTSEEVADKRALMSLPAQMAAH
ncbi:MULTISPECIES: c-type cytochrome [unclassified Pantoea]|uniref:c-type cytochrome n=1 Tax=unclassified Pantoea TaxID=2630326 RepID=UPI001CD43ABB|nr:MULTISPECIES: c-type cytochrome [unclassified Pantoea]MCA1177587.1 c-type cytochrome [Pantoea sp. alder69]MCA1249507.1 c-type cytochrome [Pantoea sp. alder70]MCA1266076.1 c-type cytochrome [Pantoea sp. alder81]